MKTRYCNLLLIGIYFILGNPKAMAQQINPEPSRKLSSFGFFEGEVPPMPIYTKTELMTGFSAGTYDSTSQTSSVAAEVSLARLIARQVQVGGEGGLTINNSKGNTDMTFALAGFGIYNFSARISNSYFLRGGWGFASHSQSGSSLTKTNTTSNRFFFGGGRRFELWHHLSYSPEVRVLLASGESTAIDVRALNFSVLF